MENIEFRMKKQPPPLAPPYTGGVRGGVVGKIGAKK